MPKTNMPRPVFFCQCGDHAWAALTRGYLTLVSPEDAYLLADRGWTSLIFKKTVYARRGGFYLHRAILDAPETDHKNRNGLDNRRPNLRKSTRQQNQANRGRWKTGFKGVRFVHGGWQARITVLSKELYLGRYASPELAAQAYDKTAILHFGEFATLNFPQAEAC